MPIPVDVMRIELNGVAGTSEIFSTGFFMTHAPTSEAEANTVATHIATELAGPTLDAIRSLMNPDSAYTTVKLYSYPTGGPTASFIGEAPILAGAGSSGSIYPLQQAMVVTLRTGLAGRSRRGRMYLPANGEILDAGHVFPTAKCSAIATAVGEFFQALNADFGASRVVVASSALSATADVTELTVDQRPDVQRRRADRQSGGTVATFVV